ncbi:hypothetical protein KFK09_002990 [Dendrobium nobile]|uniref:Retrotransposon gag domain-containing protein n=1 Tax=Dendrobium nobile TaxID=94219 RepID=A0A8T3C7V4_DENNO|nr:hypothetical protein KFK09_002990 [Dendrobium nobile]
MDPIRLQKSLDDIVNLVGNMTRIMTEKPIDYPHSNYVSHSAFQPRPKFKPQRPRFEPPYRLPTFDGSLDPYYFREWVRQLEDYFESHEIPNSRQFSIARSHLSGNALQFWMMLEDHKESRGEYPTSNWKNMRRELGLKYLSPTYGHPSVSNIRVAAPPYRSSPNHGGRPSTGPSVRSNSCGSPLGPTLSHPSQPLTSPIIDPASVINKKKSSEPKTECIHFVDANDINDNEGYFEDETEVIELDPLPDLNPDLGGLEPFNLETLAPLETNIINDIPLDKVCLYNIDLIPKEIDLTLNTIKLKLEDSNLITEMNSGNSDLEDSTLSRKVFEPNLYQKSSFDLLEPIFGVVPLDLPLKEFVLPDWAYPITPPTNWNENINPHFHVGPTSTLGTIPRLLSPITAGDSLGYVFMVESDDPSSYHTPDSYIVPATSLFFPVKDLSSPSWLTLLNHLTTPGRLSVTRAKMPYGDALLAKDVFIAPPTPVPLDRTL